MFGGFKDSSLLFLWNGFEMASLLGTILLLVGLARAGVLAWWNLAIFVGRLRGPDLHPVGPAEALRRRGAGRLLAVRDDRCPAVPAGGDRPPLVSPTGHSLVCDQASTGHALHTRHDQCPLGVFRVPEIARSAD